MRKNQIKIILLSNIVHGVRLLQYYLKTFLWINSKLQSAGNDYRTAGYTIIYQQILAPDRCCDFNGAIWKNKGERFFLFVCIVARDTLPLRLPSRRSLQSTIL